MDMLIFYLALILRLIPYQWARAIFFMPRVSNCLLESMCLFWILPVFTRPDKSILFRVMLKLCVLMILRFFGIRRTRNRFKVRIRFVIVLLRLGMLSLPKVVIVLFNFLVKQMLKSLLFVIRVFSCLRLSEFVSFLFFHSNAFERVV